MSERLDLRELARDVRRLWWIPAFLALAGQPLLLRSALAFEHASTVTDVVAVVPEAFVDQEKDVAVEAMPHTDGAWGTQRFVDPLDAVARARQHPRRLAPRRDRVHRLAHLLARRAPRTGRIAGTLLVAIGAWLNRRYLGELILNRGASRRRPEGFLVSARRLTVGPGGSDREGDVGHDWLRRDRKPGRADQGVDPGRAVRGA